MELTKSQIQKYQESGFLLVENLFLKSVYKLIRLL
jgi:hypothetical protein